MHTIEADYLVVGGGAMAMAFVDALVAETSATSVASANSASPAAGARVAVVDRNHAPGGHWTIAYPFVRLHQPSAFYGVNSLRLGGDTIDQVGWNRGLYELATAGEICAYYDHIMRRRLLPTGRVSYFPMSEYLGDGRFRTLAGADHTVRVARRVVDATYMRVTVPAMRPPPYRVGAGRLQQPAALVRRPGLDVVVVRGAPGPVRPSDRSSAAVGVGEAPGADADIEHRQDRLFCHRHQTRSADDRRSRTLRSTLTV